MKRLIFVFLMAVSLGVFAQETNIQMGMPETKVVAPLQNPAKGNIDVKNPGVSDPEMSQSNDTTYYLHDFRSWRHGYLPVRYGLGMCNYGMPWGLHKGLNMSLEASVFGFFGSGAPKGVGFGQRVSALYVAPITDRLTAIVGGYFNNTYFSKDNYRDAGLYGELTYRFDEHWEASIYGQKSLTNNYASRLMPHYMYDLNHMGDRIGGAVRYNFSPSFSVQVSMEYCKPNTYPGPPQRRGRESQP